MNLYLNSIVIVVVLIAICLDLYTATYKDENNIENIIDEMVEIKFKLTSITLDDREIIALNNRYSYLKLKLNHLNRKKL